MTPPIPTDSDLRRIVNAYDNSSNIHILATAEIARRAAASEGFAAGDVVTWAASGNAVTIVSGEAYIVEAEGETIAVFAADLTPVPPAPTAIEVFAEAYRTLGFADANAFAYATFREFCREAGIPADEPLGGAR